MAETLPPIAVQLIGHAQKIAKPNWDASDCFKQMKKNLGHFSLRKKLETKSRVIFTAQHQKRAVTVVLTCGDLAEEDTLAGAVLYLSFNGKRPSWMYVDGRRGI